MAEADSVKPPPLPPNYVSIAQLQERWLKEKQRKQQEQEKQEQQKKQEEEEEKRKQEEKNPVRQNKKDHRKNHQNQRTQVPVGKNLQKGKNHSDNVSCVITKEPKLKEFEITEPVVEESVDGTKKKNGYFGKRKFRVKEEIVAVDSVGNGKSEIAEGKNQLNFEDEEVKEMGRPVIHPVSNSAPLGTGISPLTKDKEVKEVGDVSMVEVVGENKVDREMHVQRGKLVYKVKNDRRRIVEQSVEESCAEKDVISAEVKERTNEKVNVRGAFRKYDHLRRDVASVSTVGMAEEEITTVVSVGNGGKELSKGKNLVKSEDKEINEVGSVNMVEVVGENSVDRETKVNSRVGFKEKKDSRRVVKQSRQENSTEKEVVSADVKERTIEKVSVRGAFRKYDQLRRDVAGNVASVSTVDMAEGNITTVVSVGNGGKELSKGKNLLKSEDKEINGVGRIRTGEVVGENSVGMETAVQRSKVRFKGKKDSRRMVEQSRQENSIEKEVVSADVKERTIEKVSVRGAFHKHGHLRRDVTGDVANVSTIDIAEEEITTPVNVGNSGKELSKGINQLKGENKEINEVGSVYMVEVVGEKKIDKGIPLQRSTDGFRGKQGSRRMMGIKVGEVGDKADSMEQSQQENNAEEVVVSDNVKERTTEKVRGGDGYGDKKGDVPLVVSEANIKIERNFGNLTLSNRRYGYGSSSNRGYGNKWRYGDSSRYEPRRMLNRRDSSFVWIKKRESSDGNIAEIETQVDSSSQSTSQSQQCSQ